MPGEFTLVLALKQLQVRSVPGGQSAHAILEADHAGGIVGCSRNGFRGRETQAAAGDGDDGLLVTILPDANVPGILRRLLEVLEQRSAGTASSSQKASVLDDLPLFAHQPPPAPKGKDPVHEALDAVRPDEMTPRQAIDALYQLKKLRDDARRN